MKRILTAAILIPIVLLLDFLPAWGQWIFTLGTALVACLAAWEYLTMARHADVKPPRIVVLVAIALLYASYFEWKDHLDIIGVVLCAGLLLWCTFTSPIARALPDAACAVFGFFYAGATLMALPFLHEQSNGPSLIVFLFCAVWAGDIAALYAGRLLGRHKLAPTISPGKTWEGSIASILGSIAVTGGLLALSEHLLTRWNSVVLSFHDEIWWYWLILAAIVNIAAQVGDLAESALKRSAGVKDSGTLLPGHGGILDRIDALLIAAPVLWYAQIIRQHF